MNKHQIIVQTESGADKSVSATNKAEDWRGLTLHVITPHE